MNMAQRTLSCRVTALGLATVVGLTTLTAFAPQARADEVSPTGKGIAGGALLGGEVVTITEALAGVHAGWPYYVFGGLGMVGGGVGGYFVEQASNGNGQGPVYMLAGGLALVIPALVLSLNATRYRPNDGATEDRPPASEPSADPGTLGGGLVAPAAAPAAPAAPAPKPATPAPTSLLDVRVVGQPTDGFHVGVPLPQVRAMYTPREQATYGLPQRAEFRMPVLAVTF
jgi:MFS family permease